METKEGHLVLMDSEQVSDHLARVAVVIESINDGYGSIACHLFHSLARLHTHRDNVHVARNNFGRILQRTSMTCALTIWLDSRNSI